MVPVRQLLLTNSRARASLPAMTSLTSSLVPPTGTTAATEYKGSGRRPPLNPSFPILFRDESYICVDKPYDVRIDVKREKEKGAEQRYVPLPPSTVQGYLEHTYPEVQRHLRPCHQLDYATSGVFLYGLTRESAREAGNAFESRRTDKHYLALVFGFVESDAGSIQGLIDYDETDPMGFRMVLWPLDSGKPGRTSETRFVVLARGVVFGKEVSKLLLIPKSGRRHQLRLHTAVIRHPILGDATYTDDDDSPRMMLHAWKLRLRMASRTLDIVSPDPFASLLPHDTSISDAEWIDPCHESA
ncbi:mitochondrial pseudouridine synthase RsuA/RluD family protein [Andalucia godoyi]|uniref:Mitochondrial pseudouridine synthase RsuA/RluD family protein n=1 Tax=Andalucia godoyi TaxID=505711 RepID=A0A8K0AHD6_ANDGO|nr:mitochondrial pseudouridine synthase RsuA/RluD family protein [Andalucia godoyi]|eukprot:ANDGO_06189.mRNA.1 mitochondrial pseudouridine synthase RsuA/RluD family protein